jgi:hypothetical protein
MVSVSPDSFDADQLLDLAEIDHVGRRGQPLLHHRDQRVAAGEIFRLRALGEQRRGFVDRGGAMIGCLVHVLSPSSGVLSSREPGFHFVRKHSYAPIASVMALITAAGAPIAPASPQPLTPSGLPGHSVVVCVELERRQVVGARHGVVHERAGHELAVSAS